MMDIPHERLVSLRRKIDQYKIAKDREECEDSLYLFLQGAWKYIAPNAFVPGWHLEAIAEHLEAVRDGDIRRLIINIPPRTSKSSLLSVAFPAWVWANTEDSATSGPSTQFLFASYAQSLSIRDSRKCRQLIMSPWYQDRWGHRFKMSGDQNSKIRFENDKQGYRLSTSVDGALTGEGGSIIGVDDPHNTQESESAAVVESTLTWWDNAMSTRLNDPKTGAFIVTMQRQAENDLTGHILSQEFGGWEHLMLPMRFEAERRCVTSIGWVDPRKEDGDLLCEERFGEREVKLLEATLGKYGTAGQLQQRPQPRGGSIVKAEWWRLWDDEEAMAQGCAPGKYPSFEYLIATFDGAFTEKTENDPCAMTVWGAWQDNKNHTRFMLVHAWAEHLEFHPSLVKVAATAKKYKIDRLLVENKATGISVAQEIRRLYSGTEDWATQLVDPKGLDKVQRINAVSHLWEAGLVYAPNTRWAQMMIDELASFPKGRRDDLCDCAGHAMKHFRDNGMAQLPDEAQIIYDESITHRKMVQRSLYPV